MDFSNFEYECHLLSIAMLDNKVLHKLNSDLFFNSRNKKILNTMIELKEKSADLNILTISNEMGEREFLAKLSGMAVTSHNAQFYINELNELNRKRGIQNILISTNLDQNSNEILEDINKRLFNVCQNRSIDNCKHIKDLMHDTVDKIEEYYQKRGSLAGLPSGIEELDELSNGWIDDELVIIGARPSIGKTAFMMQLVWHAAKQNHGILVFSAEMSAHSLVLRLLTSLTKLTIKKIQRGALKETDFHRIMASCEEIVDKNIYIDDTANISIDNLKLIARQFHRSGIKLITIDHLRHVKSRNRSLPLHEQTQNVTEELKALQKELKIPIIVLSQLGRQSEGKVPALNDLRDSGAVEEIADKILFLHRDRENPTHGLISLAKHRNGATGKIECIFDLEAMTFSSRF